VASDEWLSATRAIIAKIRLIAKIIFRAILKWKQLSDSLVVSKIAGVSLPQDSPSSPVCPSRHVTTGCEPL